MAKILGPFDLPPQFYSPALANFSSSDVQSAFYVAGGGRYSAQPSTDIAIVDVRFASASLKPLIRKGYEENREIGVLCCSPFEVYVFTGSYPSNLSENYKAHITYAPVMGQGFGDEVEIELPEQLINGSAFGSATYNIKTRQIYFSALMNNNLAVSTTYFVIDAESKRFVKTFESPNGRGERGLRPVVSQDGMAYFANDVDSKVFRYDGVSAQFVEPIEWAGSGSPGGLAVDDAAGELHVALVSIIDDVICTTINTFDMVSKAKRRELPPFKGMCVELSVDEEGRLLFCLCQNPRGSDPLGVTVVDLEEGEVLGTHVLSVEKYLPGLSAMRSNKTQNCLMTTFATEENQPGYFVIHSPAEFWPPTHNGHGQ